MKSSLHKLRYNRQRYKRLQVSISRSRRQRRRHDSTFRSRELSRTQRGLRILRDKLIKFMGGQCGCCGANDPRVLELDHIAGGGTKERRTLHHTSLWRKILKTQNRHDTQLLCANCNRIKRYENNEFHPNMRALT